MDLDDEEPATNRMPYDAWLAYVCEVACPECGATVGVPCTPADPDCGLCAPSVHDSRNYARTFGGG